MSLFVKRLFYVNKEIREIIYKKTSRKNVLSKFNFLCDLKLIFVSITNSIF